MLHSLSDEYRITITSFEISWCDRGMALVTRRSPGNTILFDSEQTDNCKQQLDKTFKFQLHLGCVFKDFMHHFLKFFLVGIAFYHCVKSKTGAAAFIE